MFKRAYALVLAAAVTAAGCNQTSTTSESGSASSMTTSATATTPAPSTPAATAPAPAGGGQVHKLASGLQYEDQVVGSGKMAEPGMNVSINYTGYLTDGSKFDSSLDRGQPLIFQVGNHQMIAGFDEGVRGMRIGGKRKITVPPDMGYGADGRPPVIPPNSTLVFDLELLDVK